MNNPTVVFSKYPSRLEFANEDGIEAWEKRVQLLLPLSFSAYSILYTHYPEVPYDNELEVQIPIFLVKKLYKKGFISKFIGTRAFIKPFSIPFESVSGCLISFDLKENKFKIQTEKELEFLELLVLHGTPIISDD